MRFSGECEQFSSDLEPCGFLPDDAALGNPERADPPIIQTLDTYDELRKAISGRSPEFRSHFLSKAQGAESGEMTWYFRGRENEIADLSAWLSGSQAEIRVVTGAAGSGKSALLGHLAVLAAPDLVDAYVRSGLAPQLAAGPRPPAGVFQVIVHLTGKSKIDFEREVWDQLNPSESNNSNRPSEADVLSLLRHQPRLVTILVDALDEAEEPAAIAGFLAKTVVASCARVLVGTRRSLSEGPDQPVDPSRRELLDALTVSEAETIVVERDQTATSEYVFERLTGSAHYDEQSAGIIAARIAGFDEPFLFARLATAELLARPPMRLDAPELDRLFPRPGRGNANVDGWKDGHRRLFAAAIDRIAGINPSAVVMLRALSLARGRGLPRHDGIWVDVARALIENSDGLTITEDDVERTKELAAPYITLDADAGESTYRLAHQTFVEHFRALGTATANRNIARALYSKYRHRPHGWSTANHYAVRFLAEHYTADGDHGALNQFALTRLVTDAGWLRRAVGLLGVDRVVDVLAAAKNRSMGEARLVRNTRSMEWVDTVERALRRSRVTLAREPEQLAAQMRARLEDHDLHRLRTLGDRIGSQADTPWLRMMYGRLDWRLDLNASYTDTGKVRALTFGEVDRHPVVIIAIDTRVVLWDPLRGSSAANVVIELGELHGTAMCIQRTESRSILVVAGLEGMVQRRDLETGELIGRPASTDYDYIDCIAVGLVDRQLVIAGTGRGRLRLWTADDEAASIDIPPHLNGADVRGVSVHNGRLVVHVLRRSSRQKWRDRGHKWPEDDAVVCVVIGTGEEVFTTSLPHSSADLLRVVAGTELPGGFAQYAIVASGYAVWLPELQEEIVADDEDEPDVYDTRAVSIGWIDGRTFVALSPDYDTTARVEVWERSLDGDRLGADPPDPEPHVLGWRNDELDELLPPSTEHGPLRLDEPELWPRTAACRGTIDGRDVAVTGSILGAMWLWDLSEHEPKVVSGPYTAIDDRWLATLDIELARQAGPPSVAAVAIGRYLDHDNVVAVVCGGIVRLVSVPDGHPVGTLDADAGAVTTIALGRISRQDVLITGSRTGDVVVWDLPANSRLAAITLDAPIGRVRVDETFDQVSATTIWNEHYDFELALPD